MAETTHTLAQLRQDIASQLRMPFFQRWPTGGTLTGTPTTTLMFDSKLVQEQNRWKGHWFYLPSTQEVRLITSFGANSEQFSLEFALTDAPSAGATYEIHSIWNANDIHSAINDAIDHAFPAFFKTVIDETLVIESDKMAYDISSLATEVYRVTKIWYEEIATGYDGMVDSATATTAVDSDLIGILSDVDTSWKISIYKGTGSGQLRDVSSVDDSTGEVTVTSAWTTNPDTTSYFKLWDPTDQEMHWHKLEHAQFDRPGNWPTTLYLLSLPTAWYGGRMRIQYVAKPGALSDETDTTVVPKDFIREWAFHILFGQLTHNNKYDRQTYQGLQEYHRQEAERMKATDGWSMPDGTLWRTEYDSSSITDDPMGWNSIITG